MFQLKIKRRIFSYKSLFDFFWRYHSGYIILNMFSAMHIANIFSKHYICLLNILLQQKYMKAQHIEL